MDIRPDRHEKPLLQQGRDFFTNLLGVVILAIGVATPVLALYVLWGWTGIVHGGLVLVSLCIFVICGWIGLGLMR